MEHAALIQGCRINNMDPLSLKQCHQCNWVWLEETENITSLGTGHAHVFRDHPWCQSIHETGRVTYIHPMKMTRSGPKVSNSSISSSTQKVCIGWNTWSGDLTQVY